MIKLSRQHENKSCGSTAPKDRYGDSNCLGPEEHESLGEVQGLQSYSEYEEAYTFLKTQITAVAWARHEDQGGVHNSHPSVHISLRIDGVNKRFSLVSLLLPILLQFSVTMASSANFPTHNSPSKMMFLLPNNPHSQQDKSHSGDYHGGGMGSSHHGCAADKSAATA